MEKRTLWERIFPPRSKNVYYTKDINQECWHYTAFSKSAFEMDTVRSAVDSLARNIAKMGINHVIDNEKGKKVARSTIQRVLKNPNEFMTQYDFLYKVALIYYVNNEVFIYPVWDGSQLVALYPINSTSYELVTSNGHYYVRFRMRYTQEYVVPYEELIHLRRFYYTYDILADPNTSLNPAIELINSQNQGIINGIKNSAIIRGILKTVGIIKESEAKRNREQFVNDNLNSSNNGGIIFVDGKYDYTPIDSKPYMVDSATMQEAKTKIFDYYGVNEDFVQNKGGYEEVYEGVLEPFANMLSQQFTKALFTSKEIGFGNEIVANTSRMKFQSIDKVNATVTTTYQLGLFTINEYREMYGFEPVENGDIRQVSLNFVDSNNQNSYQGGNDNE